MTPPAKRSTPTRTSDSSGPPASLPEAPRSGTSAEQQATALSLAIACARLLSDDKCEDVVLLDVRGQSPVTDFVVLATGSSERQMLSAAEHAEELGEELKQPAYRSSVRAGKSNWLVIDFVDVVVHVLSAEARLFYDLEGLWSDATRLEWARPEPPPARSRRRSGTATSVDRNRAGLGPNEVLPPTTRRTTRKKPGGASA